MNIYGKLIDILIAICIMLLFPVMYFSKKSDLIVYEALKMRLDEYVQEITTQGKITKNGYEQFYELMNNFDIPLRIQIELEQYCYEPQYTIQEGSDLPTFTGEVLEYHNIVTQEEILDYIYQKGDLKLSSGDYVRVSITILDDERIIYAGGAIRANLSLRDNICDSGYYIYDNT